MLITRAKNECRKKGNGTYYEGHHAIPKSLGGGGGINIVLLTAREHFIAHLLLVKMTEGAAKIQMQHALWQMCIRDATGNRYMPNSRQFAVARKLKAEATSQNRRGSKHTDVTRSKLSESKIGKTTGKRTEEQKINYSTSKIGGRNPAAKQCEVLGVQYSCLKEAASALGMTKLMIRYEPSFFLINKDGSPDYSYGLVRQKRKAMSEEQRETLRQIALARPPISEETKEKLSIALKGRTSPRKGKKVSLEEKIKKSKPIVFQGIEYFGLSEACRVTGLSAYFIKKDPSFRYLPKPPK